MTPLSAILCSLSGSQGARQRSEAAILSLPGWWSEMEHRLVIFHAVWGSRFLGTVTLQGYLASCSGLTSDLGVVQHVTADAG